ncbi:minor tail protein [Gordonia phage Camerico]|nr:minor tail protein [Gordonia phage Camerico]
MAELVIVGADLDDPAGEKFNPAIAAEIALLADQALVAGTSAQYYRGDKTWQPLNKSSVGLGNVDNTSDDNKPVSILQQAALDLKQALIVAGTTSQYYRGDKTWQTLNKAAVGLSAVDNTSDANKPVSTAQNAALLLRQLLSEKNAANGYAGLDSNGQIPASLLPSFVDDVLEFANLAAFPATGETGKIYTALDSNKIYRWGGSTYTEISGSPGSTDAVPEGSVNLYYTQARADARAAAILSARSIVAGTGLTGGGALSADRTLAVAYGTAAGTAAQGNDSRLSNTRTPTDNTVTTVKIVDANVTDVKLAANAVTTAKILDTAVTAAKLNADVTPFVQALIDASIALAQRVTVRTITAADTLVLADASKAIEVDSATGVTVTIPADASVNFPIGTIIDIVQIGVGKVTVSGSGFTPNTSSSLSTRVRWSAIQLRKRGRE